MLPGIAFWDRAFRMNLFAGLCLGIAAGLTVDLVRALTRWTLGWSYSTPLWYAQRVEGRRPDLVIIDDRTRLDEGMGDIADVIDAHLGTSPVYVIREDATEAAMRAERYELVTVDGHDAHSPTQVVRRKQTAS